ncbi:MAG TPA: alpha/beta hydrolase [Azospirillaceae bacterium]|nr:alpha/beta hydrolase [Azospirillaceae bacterium]
MAASLAWLSACAASGGSGSPVARPAIVPPQDGPSGAFVVPPGGPVPGVGETLIDPDRSIVLIFNHGSVSEFSPDPCQPDLARPLSTTPEMMLDLAGSRVGPYTLVVYAYCTPSKLGDYRYTSGTGELKVERRTREIAALTARFRAQGVPAERIFLSGQSAGGWASLLLARRQPHAFNAAIAFAPAFAGEWRKRPAAWQSQHDRLFAEIAGGAPLPSLVFAFEGDTYNTPDALAPLTAVPGVDLRALPGDAIGGISCQPYFPHVNAHLDCFRRTQAGEILRFIAARVGPSV